MPCKSQIFINYRRDDSQESTVFLSQLLAVHYPGQVFFDRDTIQPGRKYLTDIRASLNDCGVVIAVIGERWLTLKNAAGELRLHDPEDILRLELKVAIDAGIPIIPVLVGNSHMPTGKDLPEDIRPLAEYQATRIYFDDVSNGILRLRKAIDARLAEVRHPQPVPPSPRASSHSPETARLPASNPAPADQALDSSAFPGTPRASASKQNPAKGPFLFRRAWVQVVLGLVFIVLATKVIHDSYARLAAQQREYLSKHRTEFVIPGVRDDWWTVYFTGGLSPDYSNGLEWAADDAYIWKSSFRMRTQADAWRAVQQYKDAGYGSHSDWRVPTAEEMKTLCGSASRRALYKATFYEILVPGYWTSDIPVTPVFNCVNGEIDNVPEGSELAKPNREVFATVRPVRGALQH